MSLSLSHDDLVLPDAGRTGLLVKGIWTAPMLGGELAVENPCRRSVIATVGASTTEDVDRAVQGAEAAFPAWRRLAARERGALLTRLADAVAGHAEDIARLLAAETGNALRTQSRPETASAADVLRYYGGAAAEQKGETLPLGPGLFSYSVREPLGAVASIIPWNSPLVLAAVKIGMALATGNTLVLKPAEDAPLAVLRVAELAAGILPPGVLNVVTGTGEAAGAPLAGHPSVAKVSFTGSSEVGRSVLHAVADRIGHATLELGGKSPCIVHPDSADAATADAVIAAMRFARQGQSCTAGSRLFVHADVWDDFLPLLADRVRGLKTGDALEEDTDLGALINTERYDAVREYIAHAERQGAQFLTGSVPPPRDPGAALQPEPTILTGVENTWRIAREEVFGPVLVAIPWRDEDEVIRWANDTHYGLAAFVFTRDIGTALRAADRLDAGWVQVNRAGGQIPGMSYGGRKQSGIGSEYSIEGALESYTARKSVTISL